jgi:hypothetical protein
MPAQQPPVSLEAARQNVVNAFAALPSNAFEQCITWLCADSSRPFRFDALSGVGMQVFRGAVAGYFEAKQGK